MKTALHFGAGNIGRGFIGKLLAESGYEVVFADISAPIIERLNQDRAYTVRTVGDGIDDTARIENVRGIYSNDPAAVAAAVKDAALITTAVGPAVLEILAPTLAKALAARYQAGGQPLNIIACENMVRGTTFLKEKVLAAAGDDRELIEANTGFVDSAVDRIVPPVTGGADNPLFVTVEDFCEWIVDKTQFKGEIPEIAGMTLTGNLMAFVERKLFTLNTGHAAAAYFGKAAGKATVKDAIDDGEIRAKVEKLMQQSGAVLVKRYGFDAGKHQAYIEKILKRFANPHLHDDVDRVGRQPLRKLSASDRLIKPLNGMREYGLPYDAAIPAIASALHYQNPQDEQAQELQQKLADKPFAQAVSEITGITDKDVLAKIEAAYKA